MKKVGIIGTGWIFQNEHVLGYIQSQYGYIHGFYDTSEDLAKDGMLLYHSAMEKRLAKANTPAEKELCEKGLKSKFYATVEDLLAEVDAVDICTPPQFHMYYAKMAAEKKKAILCEKPLARTYLDAKETLDLLQDVPFYLFTQVIYNPIFKMGKEIIDSGKLGEIKRMRCCHATLDLSHTVEKEAFWDPQKSGGGALKDIGPHAFSVLRYWLGKDYQLQSVQTKEIATIVPSRTIQNKPNFHVKVEDIAKLETKWKNTSNNEVTADLEAYWIEKSHLPKELKLAGLYHEIEGTNGTMTFPNGTLGLLLGKKPYFGIHVFFKITHPDGSIEKISMPNPKPHTETFVAIDDFLSGKKSRSPAWYGEDMMTLLDSAYLSKKQGNIPISPKKFLEYINSLDGESNTEKAQSFINEMF